MLDCCPAIVPTSQTLSNSNCLLACDRSRPVDASCYCQATIWIDALEYPYRVVYEREIISAGEGRQHAGLPTNRHHPAAASNGSRLPHLQQHE